MKCSAPVWTGEAREQPPSEGVLLGLRSCAAHHRPAIASQPHLPNTDCTACVTSVSSSPPTVPARLTSPATIRGLCCRRRKVPGSAARAESGGVLVRWQGCKKAGQLHAAGPRRLPWQLAAGCQHGMPQLPCPSRTLPRRTCDGHVALLHKRPQPQLAPRKAARQLGALRVLARVIADHAPLAARLPLLQVAAGVEH